MSYNETYFLILIILIFIKLNTQSLASRREITLKQEGKNEYFYDFKNLKNYDGIYRTNGRKQDQNDYEKKHHDTKKPKYLKRSIRDDFNKEYERKQNNIKNKFTLLGEELFDIDEENPDKIIDIVNNNYPSYLFSKENGIENPNYEDEMLNINAGKTLDNNDLVYRREVSSNDINRNMENSSLYPSVLTKALQISLNPSNPSHAGGGLIGNVAQQLNTSTLDLAKELTKSDTTKNNDHYSQIFQSYLSNNKEEGTTEQNQTLTQTKESLTQNPTARFDNKYLKNEEILDGISTSNLAEILDRVLNKLESIYDGINNDYDDHPDGAPCDIIGSWSSTTLGLCFNIELGKEKPRDISPAEINNKLLKISVVECTPPKRHQIIDFEWKFTGSALKQLGGPFFLYGQKRSESVAATFLGFCRTCGDLDTMFGSWNLLSPSKDCNDISLAFDVKRDILRRIRMEMKRKERFKELLYESRHGKF